MSNNIWSEKIQGILSLDISREIKFRDDRKELFLNLLGLKDGMTVLDVGSGTGALTRKLSKWLGPHSKIIGIDRDTNFIHYARDKAQKQNCLNVIYEEGDALNLPLKDHSVDSCISHTVIEHVPNKEFLLEQKRVCKLGGRVSVMFARPDKYIKTNPDLLPKQSEREKELFEKLFIGTEDIDKLYNVGLYWPDSVELPTLFEELGFKDVLVDAIAIPMVIDNFNNSMEEKIVMIKAEMEQLYESIKMGLTLNKNGLTKEDVIELKSLINDRINKRLNYLNEGKCLWDYTIYIIHIVSGIA